MAASRAIQKKAVKIKEPKKKMSKQDIKDNLVLYAKKMSFWVSEAEQKKIKKLVAKTGLSQREYLLSAALGRTIYQVEELKPTLFELKAIGRNVNQLTMLAHQGRVMTVNLTEATNALERNYAAINGLYDALDGTVASGNVEPSDEVIDDGNV